MRGIRSCKSYCDTHRNEGEDCKEATFRVYVKLLFEMTLHENGAATYDQNEINNLEQTVTEGKDELEIDQIICNECDEILYDA